MTTTLGQTIDPVLLEKKEGAAASDQTPALDVAALFQVSMLTDALRDTARAMSVAEKTIAFSTLETMTARFNKLRQAYLALLGTGDSTRDWVPNELSAPLALSDVLDGAAALASLIDTTMHTPSVLIQYKMATSKITQMEQVLGFAKPDSIAAPSEGAGQYL